MQVLALSYDELLRQRPRPADHEELFKLRPAKKTDHWCQLWQ